MDLLIVLVFVTGLCILLYPQASDYINRIRVVKNIRNYERMVREITPEIHALAGDSSQIDAAATAFHPFPRMRRHNA